MIKQRIEEGRGPQAKDLNGIRIWTALHGNRIVFGWGWGNVQHSISADSSEERVQAHWDGFQANHNPSTVTADKRDVALKMVWELQKFCNDHDEYLGAEVNEAVCGVWDALNINREDR
jgi:hypothetical protein